MTPIQIAILCTVFAATSSMGAALVVPQRWFPFFLGGFFVATAVVMVLVLLSHFGLA